MSDPLASNPFDEFESAGEIAGFIFRKYGAAKLRECLGMTTEGSTTTLTAEFLEDAAAELEQVDLLQAAAVVQDIAAGSPGELDLCPYDPDSANGRSWLTSRMRRQRRIAPP